MNPAEVFQAAVRAFGSRDWAQAEALCRQVLRADPLELNALHLLGLTFAETGRLDEAIATFRTVIAQQPGDIVPWVNLGEVYRKSGRFAEAVQCQLQAIGLDQNCQEAYYNLTLAYRGLGKFNDAITTAQWAVKLRPNHAASYYLLGNLLRDVGRPKEAIPAYQAALGLRVDWADAHIDLAAAWQALDEPAKALDHYRQALRLKPGASMAEYSMGAALMALGRVNEARAAYERTAASDEGSYGNPINVLFRETLAEVIPADRATIASYRERVQAALEAFVTKSGHIDLVNLHTRGAVPSLMLAYYGGDVRPIMEQYARAIGPHIRAFRPRLRQGKPRLGIVVTAGHEWGFAQCWGGIAEHLSRESFDITVICSRTDATALQSMLRLPPQEYLVLPTGVADAARLLHDREFDWLHYWEIGTDAINYYLPFFRPAPGQSACWGWPVTSGNPHVDAYLSCEQVEPPHAAAHYTERLVLLKSLPVYFARPAESANRMPRSHFGLEERQRVYVCTQNLRKYHPDFDLLLADLLRADPQGTLLIFADAQSNITNLLINRFRRTMPDVASRVRVMPRMPRAEYLALLAVSDVAVDTPHFGAGVTAYDAAAVGTPFVTLPGEFQRTRWAAAINRRLGVEQLIAATSQEYVATSVEVANNSHFRESLNQQILRAAPELFEDAAVIREHETWFSEAITTMRRTTDLRSEI